MRIYSNSNATSALELISFQKPLLTNTHGFALVCFRLSFASNGWLPDEPPGEGMAAKRLNVPEVPTAGQVNGRSRAVCVLWRFSRIMHSCPHVGAFRFSFHNFLFFEDSFPSFSMEGNYKNILLSIQHIIAGTQCMGLPIFTYLTCWEAGKIYCT